MKILIVDDSALIRSILKQVISESPDFEVVGEASNGKSGFLAVKEYNPDLVILDINMPVMDGIDATRLIMSENPCPILIFSTMINADTSFKACQAGAMDVMAKPDISQFNDPDFLNMFFEKLRMLVKQNSKKKAFKITTSNKFSLNMNTKILPSVLVIGASTGGPKAVRTIIEKLPGDLPVPVVLVQHLEKGFDQGYCDWLNESTELKIHLVKKRIKSEKGVLYVAPTEQHIIFQGKEIILNDGAKILNQKPSVDVLFNSSAGEFGPSVLGVLLTGMGSDGAKGCLDIIQAGGITLVQDEASSAIYGMPKEAVRLGAASYIMALEEIPGAILRILEHK